MDAKDFFISYTQADRSFAEWIAWTLEEAGRSTVFQAWDFRVGENFVLKMNEALEKCRQVIAVISPHYLEKMFTQLEYAAVLALDPNARRLLPVRVVPCAMPPTLRPIAYCDLVGLDESTAKARLLDAVRTDRPLPATRPPFPSTAYPGAADPLPRGGPGSDIAAARELLEVLETTATTFVAQARIRDELVADTTRRLGITERLEFEPFFAKYFDQMDEDERRRHAIIRTYTKAALARWNTRALELLDTHAQLVQTVPLLPRLQQHLRLWLTKFNGVFENTPAMCLVYVGVHERVGFPTGVEDRLREYLLTGA